jgi:DNA-binding XRE family transcriptional regulator
MADFLSIARTSYINIEQDKREITLGEANTLASIFGVSLDDISEEQMPNILKYKDIIISFLKLNMYGKSDGKRDGKIPKTKLAKLVYLADFAWYYENLVSMSGMQYKKFEYGPVPDIYFRVLDEMYSKGEIAIEQKGGAMLVSLSRGGEREEVKNLNPEETDLIKKISKKWEDKNTQEIVDFTHKQMPWKFGRDGEVVHYELITQEDPEHVY